MSVPAFPKTSNRCCAAICGVCGFKLPVLFFELRYQAVRSVETVPGWRLSAMDLLPLCAATRYWSNDLVSEFRPVFDARYAYQPPDRLSVIEPSRAERVAHIEMSWWFTKSFVEWSLAEETASPA